METVREGHAVRDDIVVQGEAFLVWLGADEYVDGIGEVRFGHVEPACG